MKFTMDLYSFLSQVEKPQFQFSYRISFSFDETSLVSINLLAFRNNWIGK